MELPMKRYRSITRSSTRNTSKTVKSVHITVSGLCEGI